MVVSIFLGFVPVVFVFSMFYLVFCGFVACVGSYGFLFLSLLLLGFVGFLLSVIYSVASWLCFFVVAGGFFLSGGFRCCWRSPLLVCSVLLFGVVLLLFVLLVSCGGLCVPWGVRVVLSCCFSGCQCVARCFMWLLVSCLGSGILFCVCALSWG